MCNPFLTHFRYGARIVNTYSAAEAGRTTAAPPLPFDTRGLPPGSHEWLVPHIAQFMGQWGGSARAYDWRFDSASAHGTDALWRVRYDPMISGCMARRVTACSLVDFHLVPEDESDPLQVDAAKRQERLLRKMRRRVDFRRWMLEEAIFVGRAGAQIIWEWHADAATGRVDMYPLRHVPVSGDKLHFRWDDTPGIAVGGAEATKLGATGNVGPYRIYWVEPHERHSIVVHQHQCNDASFFRPQQAGAVKGIGLRDVLYYLWVLKSQVWTTGLEYLQRFAMGISLYWYEHGNTEHRDAMAQAVRSQDGRSAMLLPLFRDRNGPQASERPFEHVDVSNASPQFLQSLLSNYFDDLIRFIILHQSLTTSTAPTGLGSGVASAHQTTADELAKLDCTLLDETLTHDLVRPMYLQNEPGIPPARFVSNLDSPNVQQMLEGAQVLVGMGGSVAMEPLAEAIGLPAPKPGQTILGGPQPTQPAAVTEIPDGTPVVQGGVN